jgi:hypothetical protein
MDRKMTKFDLCVKYIEAFIPFPSNLSEKLHFSVCKFSKYKYEWGSIRVMKRGKMKNVH